jgi:hypothetical protein
MHAMSTCEKHTNHVIVVYDNGGCPLCDAEDQIDKYLKEISELRPPRFN